MPVPSPAESADRRLTSRQEKPVSVGLPFGGLRSPPLPVSLPHAALSTPVCCGERCGVRPWWEEKCPGGFNRNWGKKIPVESVVVQILVGDAAGGSA